MKPIKTISAIAAALLLLSGCVGATGNVPDKERRCGMYANAYAIYTATSEFREVSADEKAAALKAVEFLKVYCGWRATRAVDKNGVPVIQPPK